MDPNTQPTDPSTNLAGTEIKPSSSMPEMPAAEPMVTPGMGVTPTVSDLMPAPGPDPMPAADPMPAPGPVEAPVTPAPMTMPAAATPMANKSNKKMMMIVVVVVIVVAVAAFMFMNKN